MNPGQRPAETTPELAVKDVRADPDGPTAAYRPSPWDELDTSMLDAEKRAIVGRTWRERMRQEHLAVGAFALLAQELAAEGCCPAVLSRVTRAAADEVRHAEVCRKMAVGLLGSEGVPTRFRGLPRVPPHESATSRHRVLFHVVEMCCLSETLTGVCFTEMLLRARPRAVRTAVRSLLEDEIDHGRVGWAYLAERAREGSLQGLAQALPAMIDRTIGRALRDARRTRRGDDLSMEAFGYLGNDASAVVFVRALRDVIVPGFETLGVDLKPARETINMLCRAPG